LTWIELTFAVIPSACIIATIRSTSVRDSGGDVLAIIDREIGIPIPLVGGERAARYRATIRSPIAAIRDRFARASIHRRRSAERGVARHSS
jgi:hypothetical protein